VTGATCSFVNRHLLITWIEDPAVKFSVVIPTLNEESTIRESVSRVREIGPDVEIVVVDGGSADATIRAAEDEGALVCESRRGRGPQLNVGARLSSGEVIFFLHADTRLPDNAFRLARELFQDGRVQVAKFRLTFDMRNLFLHLCTKFTRYDSIITSFGDQCIVVRRSFFDSLGGFPEWPLFEDVHFLRMARNRTRVYSLPAAVTTSARRFARGGAIRQIVRNGWYILLYLLGVSPERLAGAYEGAKVDSATTSVALFARYPRPGEVKTRLGRYLGAEPAVEFYRMCAERAFRECAELAGGVRLYLAYTGAAGPDQVRSWAGPYFHLFPQKGESLGDRLRDAFHTVFSHGAKNAIVVATDVPDLSAAIIDEAIEALHSHDVAVGPCHDGGYYLLGMKKPHDELFAGIPWSSDQVLNGTLDRIANLGLTAHMLPTLTDIDTWDDLRRWGLQVAANAGDPVREHVRSLDLESSMYRAARTATGPHQRGEQPAVEPID
jgi:rSAM/selenodomain-associated transferase 2/rSAM/selenodomain-associated transferase 1